ncbi:MAG TPA: hypothetical protein VEW07_13665 [Solirubrobacterales bacterium]|nr:hypothetical protein [Solirubrobacterales bacterium]
MGEGRERLLVVPDDRYADAFAEVYEAADRAPEPLRAGVEAIVEIAELNPKGAREGLWRLQTDWKTLKLLEPHVGGGPTQAALRLGAAIHLARAELASPAPQLRRRLPELMEWLGRRELSGAE